MLHASTEDDVSTVGLFGFAHELASAKGGRGKGLREAATQHFRGMHMKV